MREKIIGYSVFCCFVLGAIYLKNKVFNKQVSLDVEEVETKKDVTNIQQ